MCVTALPPTPKTVISPCQKSVTTVIHVRSSVRCKTLALKFSTASLQLKQFVPFSLQPRMVFEPTVHRDRKEIKTLNSVAHRCADALRQPFVCCYSFLAV